MFQIAKKLIFLLIVLKSICKNFGHIEYFVKHINIVSEKAGEILEKLGYSKERVELAKIVGYLHEIGNCVNRFEPSSSSAILAYNILKDIGMEAKYRTEIMIAIGANDETIGIAVNDISAALILADKSDVHKGIIDNKINSSVPDVKLIINGNEKKVRLDLTIDTQKYSILDYFEMIMNKIKISKEAARYLDLSYELIINDTELL